MATYVQRKTTSLWLTALAALVALALLSVWMFGRSSSGDAPLVIESSGVTDALPAPIDAYVQFVERTRAEDAMAVNHEFTATGIRNLAAALEAVAAASGRDVQGETTSLRERADALQRDTRSMEHADQARAAFTTVSGVLTAIQTARYPSMREDVAGVARAAESIDPGIALTNQPNAVQTFFDRAAAVLRAMGSGSAT